MTSRKKTLIILLAIVVLFVGLHIPGLHGSYQQDEYKWVYLTYQSNIQAPGNIPHPPLAEFFFIVLGPLLGAYNYRVIPFVFGIVDLFLLYYLALIIFGKRTAVWTVSLFTVAFYSLLATLMVDVDGTIMPFFFLIMAIAYYKLKAHDFELKGRLLYLTAFILGAIGGVMVKLSGILPALALALDFAIEKGVFRDKKRLVKYSLIGLVSLVIIGVLVYLSKFVFTYFSISKSMVYWEHFANSSSFLSRGWFQTFIQFAKSILYMSPLLIVPAFFINKDIWRKTRPFFLFVSLGLLFYIVAFDFSLGALDRYFQFLVVPFCIISAAVLSHYIGNKDEADLSGRKSNILFPVLVGLVVFSLQFVPHVTVPLYPKALWLSRLFSFKWNFLFPFSGGSGPLPFYVSFLFISVTWVLCILFFLYSWKRPYMRKQALISILVLGLVYNAVFVEEYLFGGINGNTQSLVRDSVAFIQSHDTITKVMVYNDNGGFEVQHTGKYDRRIYAAPQFEDTYKSAFTGFTGDILFIDIPKLADDSFYKKYFDSCVVIYSRSSGYIPSTIYDCSKSLFKI